MPLEAVSASSPSTCSHDRAGSYARSAAIKAAAAKVADMEKMAKEDPTTYEAFLADARKELETTRGATASVVVAPRAGHATPHVKPGADVKAGQLLVVIE